MVVSVKLTTLVGEIEILPGHAPFMGVLAPGLFEYHPLGQPAIRGFISRGFFEVTQQSLRVMAETLELQGEIDLLRARKAQQKAEEMLAASHLEGAVLKKHQLKLQRALLRQTIGRA